MSTKPSAGKIDGPAAFASRFGVSRETLEKLQTYEALLKQWQKTVNLVAPSTLGEVWHRHFADSAQLLRLAPESAAVWLDLGSGAGFPGLVLAILLAERSECRVLLVESDTRKAAFLREVARHTGAAVDIYPGRIEMHSTQANVPTIDVITARALASLDRLLALSLPYQSANTMMLFLKGKSVSAEVEEAERRWRFRYRIEASLTDVDAGVLVIEDLRPRTEG